MVAKLQVAKLQHAMPHDAESHPGGMEDVRLCMDARMLAAGSGTGVSSYARKLRRAHAALSRHHALLTDRPALEGPAPAPLGRIGRWARALVPGARMARAVQGGAGEFLFGPDIFRLAQVYFDVHRRPLPVRTPGPPGIMHWTYPVPLVLEGWRNLYTVHDVIPLLHPALTDIDGHRYRRLLDRLAACAARFVTVSEAARAEIVATLGCDPALVVNGGMEVAPAPADRRHLPEGLEPGGYVLVCGTVEKRKNIALTLAAHARAGVALPLVIAGPDGWGGAAIGREIAATPGTIRLPYLGRDAMRALIGHARALVMPSLAEGFGLPVAEAMALGVPVITADRGALAETAGDAALLVDPTDVEALAEAMARIATDDRLRDRLAAAGRDNAARFTPARFAARLTAAYGGPMAQRA